MTLIFVYDEAYVIQLGDLFRLFHLQDVLKKIKMCRTLTIQTVMSVEWWSLYHSCFRIDPFAQT